MTFFLNRLAVSVACLALCQGLAQGAAATEPITGLFPTGVDDAGVVIPEENPPLEDPHYETRLIGSGGWVPAVVDKGNRNSSPPNPWRWWPGPGSDADALADRPIQHPACLRTASCRNRDFEWRTSFSLPEDALTDTATISYTLGWDDLSRTPAGGTTNAGHYVWLNGTPYFTACAGGDQYRSRCTGEIPAGSAFETGVNTLEWRIRNGVSYYGLRIRTISGTFERAQPVLPERVEEVPLPLLVPGALASLLATVGIAALRRGQRRQPGDARR